MKNTYKLIAILLLHLRTVLVPNFSILASMLVSTTVRKKLNIGCINNFLYKGFLFLL